jgi:hypothetical protein
MAREATEPLALKYIAKVGLAHGKPILGAIDGEGAVKTTPDDPSITDEGVGTREGAPDSGSH